MKLPISKLRNNTGQVDGVPANPRTISTDDYQKLIDSIKDDPEYLEHEMPHVIKHGDVYVVLNGNQRLRALKELGYKEVPVTIYPDDTPPDVIKARIIKSNHGYGKDDMDMLANEWSDMPLDEWGIDLPEDGLDDDSEVKEDEAPAVDESEPPKSKLGEIYQLGRHRVMCGSATDEADATNLLDGSDINLVHTDPPYGVDYQSKKLGGIMNDKFKGDSLYGFILDSFTIIKDNILNDAGLYCWYEDKYRQTFQTAIEDAGFEFKQNLIWNKGMNLSGADYQKAHENLMYFQCKDSKAKWFGERDKKTILGQRRKDLSEMNKKDLVNAIVNMQKQSTVWDIDRDSVTSYQHPTQKPVTLSARVILNSSETSDMVYDAFLGSGSTLIACEQTDRTCYGMELDPKYVDVIRKRYAKFAAADDQLPENWEELTPAI